MKTVNAKMFPEELSHANANGEQEFTDKKAP
jgi:hypothetical protein